MLLIYKRYLAKSILPPLIIITFVITGVVWITQILKLLYLIDKGIALKHFLYLIILIIPSLLFIILPFVTALAVIYTYHRLNEERQLITLRNAGLSNAKLATPALLIAIIVTLSSYYIAAQLMPSAFIKLKSDLSFIKNNYASNIISERTFNQISKLVTIYVDRKLPDGSLQGIILFDNRERGVKPAILFANSGYFQIVDNNPLLQLEKGIRQAYYKQGNLTRLAFDSLVLELKYNSLISVERDAYNRDINEYYIDELLSPDARLSESRRIKLRVEGHQRLIWPLYNLIFTFVGLAVFLKYPYNKKSQFKQLLTTALIIVIIAFYHFTIQNIASRDFNFIYISYINCLISILGGIFLYTR